MKSRRKTKSKSKKGASRPLFSSAFTPHSPHRSGGSVLNVRNAYEAASSGRRLKVWAPGQLGPNAALLHDLKTLRDRSRDAIRNNAWMKRAADNLVSNEIGTGILPRSLAPDKDFRKKVEALWEDWSSVADADGVLDIFGLMALCVRERIESGEIFVRKRLRDLNSGFPVPLQLQLLEAEFCPHGENRMLQNGRIVRAGIEFDGLGQRRAYWMYSSHPGDSFLGAQTLNLVPVPAASVMHHYTPLRSGQIRGVPWLVQALIKARDFDEYEDAELIRKKTRASYTGIIRRQNYGEEEYKFDPFTGEALERDKNEVPMMNVEPGSMPSLLPGEDVTMFDGDQGSGYDEFVRRALLGLSAGSNVPYEFLTGDYKSVNDRIMRVIRDEYHRSIEQSQWHLTIPQICNPIWIAFIDTAILSGALAAEDYSTRRAEYLKVDWHTQRWPYLHPLQDVQASVLEIQAGLSSRKRIAAERGMVVEEIDQENSEDKKRASELGLKYETGLEVESETNENPPPDDGTSP